MNYLERVLRGIEYIEANLGSDIQPAAVARHAGISQWHFQRIFKGLTNETLKTYIRTRRFSQSLEKLADTSERILEIAVDSGFESQAAFTRAFHRAFATTPAEFRKKRTRVKIPRKPPFDAGYLRHLPNVSLEPEIVDQPEMQVVGRRTQFFSVDSEKNNFADKLPPLWAEFLPRLDQVPHRIPIGGYGVLKQTDALSDELDYWAAVPVTRIDLLPPGLVGLRVPAGRYARFSHRGFLSELDKTVNYIYASWLLRSRMRHTYSYDLEFYGEGYIPDSADSLVSYSIPVR